MVTKIVVLYQGSMHALSYKISDDHGDRVTRRASFRIEIPKPHQNFMIEGLALDKTSY
jgi:hypothetical protein